MKLSNQALVTSGNVLANMRALKRPATGSADVGHKQPRRKQQPVQAEARTAANHQEKLSALRSEGLPFPFWRLELFFKSPEDLDRQLPFLRQHGLLRLNITNKSADDDLLATLHQLSTSLLQPHAADQQPLHHQHSTAQQQSQYAGSTQHCHEVHSEVFRQQGSQQEVHLEGCGSHAAGSNAGLGPSPAAKLDVCIHYSLKYQYDKSPQQSLARLLKFCQALADQQQQQLSSSSTGCGQLSVHLLLISGGGKKKRLDSVAALQALQQNHHHQQQQQQQQQQQPGPQGQLRLPPLAVAFNPYLPIAAEAAEEQWRLQAKLETCLVDKVYLQMGTDLQKLETGLAYVKELVRQLSERHPDFKPPQLLGSVFLPTRRLLAQMRFRPWNGVFLSGEYLSSVEAAEGITRQLLSAYAAAGVVPLIESAVKTDAELGQAKRLLGCTGSA